MENPSEESKVNKDNDPSPGGNDATPSPPYKPPSTRKKSQRKRTSGSLVPEESKLAFLASDGEIPTEVLSLMASRMIDTMMHNYEPAQPPPPLPSKVPPNPSTTSTSTKKKSKTSISKIESKSGNTGTGGDTGKEQSVQKLQKLADCLECEWKHNYHPCLLPDSKENIKCKDEMKRKGYQYDEPKKLCVKKDKSQVQQVPKKIPSEKQVVPPPPTSTATAVVTPPPTTPKTQSKQAVKVKSKALIPKVKSLLSNVVVVQEVGSKPKVVVTKPSKQSTQEIIKPKTAAPSVKPSKSQVSKVVSKRSTRVNFEKEEEPKVKQSTSAVLAVTVRPTSSKIGEVATVDLLKKLNSKSSHANLKVKVKDKGDRHAQSFPVSTRESRSRFNPHQLSPSDTHLPPVIVSAHEIKCKNFDMSNDQCICESSAVVASTSKSKKKLDKEVKVQDEKKEEIEKLIAEGKTGACEWQKNYHPCDKPKKKCDKTGDQQLCKLWKQGQSETGENLKSGRASCRSMPDPSSTLSTSPSEKAYIDKVVRTAVKLAKKNMPKNCKKRGGGRKSRREMEASSSRTGGWSSLGGGGVGTGSSMATASAAVSSAFAHVNSIMVDNAIQAAAGTNQQRPMRQKKVKKNNTTAEMSGVLGAESLQKKKT